MDILSQKYEIPKNYSEINSKESMAKVHERIRVYNDDSYSRYCKLDIDLMKKTEIDSQYNDYIKRYQQNVKYYNNQLDSLNKKHEKSGLPSIDDSLRYRDRYLNENNSKNLSAQLAVLEAIVSAERGELRQDEYDSSEETKNRAIAVVNMLKNKINNAIPSGIQKYDEDRSL